jgi:hypothetical protein
MPLPRNLVLIWASSRGLGNCGYVYRSKFDHQLGGGIMDPQIGGVIIRSHLFN